MTTVHSPVTTETVSVLTTVLVLVVVMRVMERSRTVRVRAGSVVKLVVMAVPDNRVVVGVGFGIVTVTSVAALVVVVMVVVVAGAVDVWMTAAGVVVVVRGPSPIRPMKLGMLRLARRAATAGDGLRRVMADRLIRAGEDGAEAGVMVAVEQVVWVVVVVSTTIGLITLETVVKMVVVVVDLGGRVVRTKTVLSAALVTVIWLMNSVSVAVVVTVDVEVEVGVMVTTVVGVEAVTTD